MPSLAPLPPLPSGPLPRAAIVERDGVRLRIELDRNPLVAGKPTWVTTEVRNTGSDDVIWLSDGCETPAGVSGRVVGVLWRLGRPQVGAAATFKKDLRFGIGGISIDFTPEGFVGKHGFGCADVGVKHRIAPGARIRGRALWDGGASERLGLPPTAPVDLTARFRFYERASRPRRGDDPRRAISLSLSSWIVGGRDRALADPPEIVDAALADTAFREWLAPKDVGNASSPFAWLDGDSGRWNVGLLEYYVVDPGRMHYVELDARSGAVVGRVERPWDQDAEGFP